MPPRQKTLTQGSWRAIALSVLLHAGIVAAAVYSWFTWKHRPPETATLAIAGTVVDERTLPKGAAPPPEPAPPELKPPEPTPPEPTPEPVPVEEQGPPKPDPAEIERKKEEERLAAEKVEQQKRDEERQAQELKEREVADRREAEKQAAAKAAAEKATAEKAAADKKAAEKKRADDAAAAKKAAADRAREASEAELRRNLEAEERGNALRNSDEANRWHAQIVDRVTRAWTRPPSARPGISCIVTVTQVPGGEVTGVRVDSCSGGDDAFRESVETAVYRASPLPTPPPGVPFERVLELTFAPNE